MGKIVYYEDESIHRSYAFSLFVCPSVCLSVCPSVRALSSKRFNRFSSNLAHRLLRARGQLLDIFSFRGQTPWGQERVKGHVLAYGQKLFIVFFDRGFKVDQLLSRDHGSNPTNVVTRGQIRSLVVLWAKTFYRVFR